jgi:hypothetical protein
LFLVKNSLVEKKGSGGDTVCCHDATTNSFVAKVWRGVFVRFHAVTVNVTVGLPGWILCQQSPWCQRKLWAYSWLCFSPVSPFSVSASLDFLCMVQASYPKACLIITRVPITLIRELNNIWCWSFAGSIARHNSKKKNPPQEINTFTHLREILYTDFQDMLILSPTIASCYYNCCTDGSTSLGNYGYPLIHFFLSQHCTIPIINLKATSLTKKFGLFIHTVRWEVQCPKEKFYWKKCLCYKTPKHYYISEVMQ